MNDIMDKILVKTDSTLASLKQTSKLLIFRDVHTIDSNVNEQKKSMFQVLLSAQTNFICELKLKEKMTNLWFVRQNIVVCLVK